MDPRLSVVTTGGKLPMAAHYERCLNFGQAPWISIVGQDDAVLPDFVDRFTELTNEFPNADAFYFRRAYFFWPGCESLYGNRRVLYDWDPRRARVQRGPNLVKSVLKGTREHHDLPQTYTNGVISRKLVESVKALSGGAFFQEATPDVYSGFALSLAAKEIVRSELPMFWTGSSPRSVGFSITITSKSEGETRAQEIALEHFSSAKEMGYSFDPSISEELWKQADNSSIWAISSLRSVPYAQRKWKSTATARLGFASFFASKWLQVLPIFAKNTGSAASHLVTQAARDMGISMWSIRFLAMLLVPLQFSNRLKRLGNRAWSGLTRRSIHVNASCSNHTISTIGEATKFIRHSRAVKKERLDPK